MCCRHVDGLHEDFDGQDTYIGSGAIGHDRECQGEDPGQRGNPSGPATSDLRWSVDPVELLSIPQPEGLNMPWGYLKMCPILRRLSVLWVTMLERCAWV